MAATRRRTVPSVNHGPQASVSHRSAPGARRLAPFVLGGLALLLLLRALHYGFLSDDAFIIARYARNVVEGHGWVFNPGDRVEGYTSFLWTALTAGLGALGLDYVLVLRGLSLAGALALLPLLYRAAPRLDEPAHGIAALVAPLLLAASSIVACWALGGLETCGYALAVLATLVLADTRGLRPRPLLLAGLAGAACALLRPEGVLVVIAVALAALVESPRRAPGPLARFFLPAPLVLVGAHALWRRAYYGDWLPNTAHAKVGLSRGQVEYGWQYLRAGLEDHGGLLVWVVPFVAVWLLYRNALLRAVSIAGALLLAGVVLVGGDGLPMYRFLVPVLPLWALLAAKLVADLWRRSPGPAIAGSRAGPALAGLAALLLVWAVADNPRRIAQYDTYVDQKNVEVPRWRAVGRWLAANAPPGASVACVPIGAIGYESGLRVYDMLGLTDRHIARKPVALGRGWSGHEKHDGPYILDQRPTYLLLGNVQVLERPLAKDSPYFCRPPVPAIRRREDDVFTPRLAREYERRIVRLDDGNYLHFFQRAEPGVASGPTPGGPRR